MYSFKQLFKKKRIVKVCLRISDDKLFKNVLQIQMLFTSTIYNLKVSFVVNDIGCKYIFQKVFFVILNLLSCLLVRIKYPLFLHGSNKS